jgi:hypothetical protein
MALSDRELSIMETARLNRDRYLLLRRHKAEFPPTDLDLDYEACSALVIRGYARWLETSGPGILLTAKGSRSNSYSSLICAHSRSGRGR